MEALRARIQKIQEGGLATPAQKLFDMAMAKPPQVLMQDFVRTSDPMVVQAMQDAVASLLGTLPPFEFDAQITATGDKLAALMLQLQMTGYLLRNAEYVMKIRQILKLRSRSLDEYREAFDRVDLDGSGYLEVEEVEQLLKEVYEGGDVPQIEIAAFVNLFDADADGRVSWDDFAGALGAVDGAPIAELPALSGSGDSSVEAPPSPRLSGTVTVELDDGSEVEMDATVYMEQLQAEADALRAELGKVAEAEKEAQLAVTSSISAYVASLPEGQLKQLTSGISDDVMDAMRQLVTYILRAPSGDGPLDKEAEVVLEQQKLQQLCFYQLVLGYRLREAEATGEANDAIGK